MLNFMFTVFQVRADAFVHGSGAFRVLRALRRALRYYCSLLSYAANIGCSRSGQADANVLGA